MKISSRTANAACLLFAILAWVPAVANAQDYLQIDSINEDEIVVNMEDAPFQVGQIFDVYVRFNENLGVAESYVDSVYLEDTLGKLVFLAMWDGGIRQIQGDYVLVPTGRVYEVSNQGLKNLTRDVTGVGTGLFLNLAAGPAITLDAPVSDSNDSTDLQVGDVKALVSATLGLRFPAGSLELGLDLGAGFLDEASFVADLSAGYGFIHLARTNTVFDLTVGLFGGLPNLFAGRTDLGGYVTSTIIWQDSPFGAEVSVKARSISGENGGVDSFSADIYAGFVYQLGGR